jgi:hypothetical protein
MDHNWPYVAAGYGLTAAVVVAYTGWLLARLRRARRSTGELPDVP